MSRLNMGIFLEKADGEDRTLVSRLETLGNAIIRHPHMIREGFEPSTIRLKVECSTN